MCVCSDNGALLTPPLVQLLDLSHNFISRAPYQVHLTPDTRHLTHPQFLSALSPSLRSLDLSYNHLTDISDSSLEKLSNLQILRLHHNRVTNIQKSAVSGLSSIQIIDLSSNQVILPPPTYQYWYKCLTIFGAA